MNNSVKRGSFPVKRSTKNDELNKLANSTKGNREAAAHYKLDRICYYYIITCMIRYGLLADYGIHYSDQVLVGKVDNTKCMLTSNGGGLEIYDPNSSKANDLKGLFSNKNSTGSYLSSTSRSGRISSSDHHSEDEECEDRIQRNYEEDGDYEDEHNQDTDYN